MGSKKLPVCIHIFPSLDAIELVQLNENSGDIEKAISLPCEFDPTSRQMLDPNALMPIIRDLYKISHTSPNTPAVLVLPSFFTRQLELPEGVPKDELRFLLLSEAERFYIFKKTEPQIDSIYLSDTRLLYSAFPKQEISLYVKAFRELRILLLGIELNYLSILRGLLATGIIRDEVEQNKSWCLIVVNDYSFFSTMQQGVRIIKGTESPLSLAPDEQQSTLQEIQQDFLNFTEGEPFEKLVIINNSTRILSDNLLNMLEYSGQRLLIEQNATTLKSRGAEDAQYPCSMEGLGGVFYKQFAESANLNFLLGNGEEIMSLIQYKSKAILLLLISNGVIFILSLLVWAFLSFLLWQKDQEQLVLTRQIQEAARSVNHVRLSTVRQKKFIKEVVDQNVKINNFLIQLGSRIPQDVWLEQARLSANKLEQPIDVQVDGKVLNLVSVNGIALTLNNSHIFNSLLEISNAAQLTSPEGQAYFTWSLQSVKSHDATGRKG